MNPSLINCCTIDWFDEWPNEAMLAVAQAQLSVTDFICADDEDPEVITTTNNSIQHYNNRCC
jgi:dynein heavy chain